jgi:hypothetical protein
MLHREDRNRSSGTPARGIDGNSNSRPGRMNHPLPANNGRELTVKKKAAYVARFRSRASGGHRSPNRGAAGYDFGPSIGAPVAHGHQSEKHARTSETPPGAPSSPWRETAPPVRSGRSGRTLSERRERCQPNYSRREKSISGRGDPPPQLTNTTRRSPTSQRQSSMRAGFSTADFACRLGDADGERRCAASVASDARAGGLGWFFFSENIVDTNPGVCLKSPPTFPLGGASPGLTGIQGTRGNFRSLSSVFDERFVGRFSTRRLNAGANADPRGAGIPLLAQCEKGVLPDARTD